MLGRMITSQEQKNNTLKISISKLVASNGTECLKKIGEKLSKVFSEQRYALNAERCHIIDYCKKKADDYNKKYDFKIEEYSYDTEKSFVADRKIIRLISDCLFNEDAKSMGFYAHDQHNFHVDAFAVHQGKIWVFQTYEDTSALIADLERKFGAEYVYVQKVPVMDEKGKKNSLYSQIDDISCPAFAMKYLGQVLE